MIEPPRSAPARTPPARAPSARRSPEADSARTHRAGDAPEPDGDAVDRERLAAAQAAVQQRRNAFDMTMKEQAELERELNALRDMSLEQLKRDDEYLKALIRMI